MKIVAEADDAIIAIEVVLEPVEVQVPAVIVPVEVGNLAVASGVLPNIQNIILATAL